MTVGPIVAAAGMLLLSRAGLGDSYASGVLPGILVLALGMALTVAPLTAAVLASVGDELTGVASGVNNAVARLAGLLAVAALPALAGVSTGETMKAGLNDGYAKALRIAAFVTAAGGLIAALVVRETSKVRPVAQPSVFFACQHPAVAET
jgi:hypothetical protein